MASVVLWHETLNLIISLYLNADPPVADEPLATLAAEASHLIEAVRVGRAVVSHLRALVHIAASPALLKFDSMNHDLIPSCQVMI